MGERSRRAADSATNIQDFHVPFETHQIGEADCRLTATDVELLDGRQIIDVERLRVFAGSFQRFEESRPEIFSSIVRIDCLDLLSHDRSSSRPNGQFTYPDAPENAAR